MTTAPEPTTTTSPAVDLPPDVVLGAMTFGTTVDDATAYAILDAFTEAGGVWVDTADCYAFWLDDSGVGGASEVLVGRWLRDRPDVAGRVRISTKVGQQPTVPHRWPESAAGLSAGAVASSVEQSLDRLGRDHVDLLWAHADDRTTPLEETVTALGDVHASGRARRLGCSNYRSWRAERARHLAARAGVEPYTALQLRHSYVEPRPGAVPADRGHLLAGPEALDYAVTEGLPLWHYTTLLHGAFVRADRPLPEIYDHPGTTRRPAALRRVADDTGATPNQVVLAWLMSRPGSTSPIVGVSSVAQVREAVRARALVLTPEQLHVLGGAS